ncbi:MFS transporter [Coralloluteibacterium stylophorae]|uniref:Alpha-ketoglutarate permease n=1 Tax=Coralloluteibacterium stylophorae TaxID=1776034 RepID=A0A8J8AWM8_9GAMM|nr:MFS transporter [Coralloluteibacterium stylophorae]MBS7455541.1 MFS transporter [Coralloluteibacterium stylophorae]
MSKQPGVAGNVVRGSLGNLIEWYDWYAYSAFAVYFARSFFAEDDSSRLLETFAVFSVGFLMRPIGGWFFGRFADRHGRRAALTLSVLMMGAGSLIITFAPTYASIGIGAPVLLVLARLLQGLSVGGEYGTSATYLSEVATPSRRGFYSSFQYVTLIAGQLLALGLQIALQQVLDEAQMSAWGWRIAFAVGAVGALTVLWLRRGMAESKPQATVDTLTDRRGRTLRDGSLALLFRYPRAFFMVLGLTLGGTVAFYTYTTYMQQFMVNTVGFAKPDVAVVNFLALLVFIVLQPLYGALSDRIGRKPLLVFFGIAGTLGTVPILGTLAGTQSLLAAFALMLAALVIVAGYTSINAIVKAELFPSNVRALGVGLPYAIANAVFGGTAPTVALWLKRIGHESWFFWYVTACIAVSLLVYLFGFRNRAETHLDRDFGHAFARRPAPVE